MPRIRRTVLLPVIWEQDGYEQQVYPRYVARADTLGFDVHIVEERRQYGRYVRVVTDLRDPATPGAYAECVKVVIEGDASVVNDIAAAAQSHWDRVWGGTKE